MAKKSSHSSSDDGISLEPQWGALVGSAVSTVLTEAMVSVKDLAESKLAEYGPKYVKKASKKLVRASEDLVEWATDHPVKTVAAAAALIAAGAFLHATMTKEEAPRSKTKSAKTAKTAKASA